MSLGGVLALFGAVVDFVVDTLAGVPGIVLMYVILVVSAGLTGRLLRRHGRLGGTYSLAGILGAVFFTLFLVIGIGLSDDLNHLPLAIFVLASRLQ
jgi:hypothetical protein